jgi:hypothetical protein
VNIPIGYSPAGMSWPLFVPDGAGGYPTSGYIRGQYFAGATPLWLGKYAAGSEGEIIAQTGAALYFSAAGWTTEIRGTGVNIRAGAGGTYIDGSNGAIYVGLTTYGFYYSTSGQSKILYNNVEQMHWDGAKTRFETGCGLSVTVTTANPYAVLTTDLVVYCNHGAGHGGVTVNLPTTRVDGDTYRIKLSANFDAANVCTIQDGAGAKNIDGAATLVLGAQYKAAHLVWSATADEWLILGIY